MAAVLTVVNNSTAVSNGFYRPRFTMNVKGLDTRKKTLNLESAQFELHYENIDPSTNKLYVKMGDSEQQLDLLTGTYNQHRRSPFRHQRNSEECKTPRHTVFIFPSEQSSQRYGPGRKDMHIEDGFARFGTGYRGDRNLNTTSLALTLSPSPSIFPREEGLFCCTPI